MSTATIRSTILRVRDEDGNWVAIPSIKGDTGPQGPSVWGGITGDLTSQTDLQSRLGDATVLPAPSDGLAENVADVADALQVLDGNVVHTTGAETISGNKTFLNVMNASIRNMYNSSYVGVFGGAQSYSSNLKDAYIKVYSSNDNHGFPGWFILGTYLDELNTRELIGKPTGSLTWDGNELYHPSLVTDSTSTSVTLTAVPDTHYTYGELTALNLAFPATAARAYQDIHIMWESGATATVLTLDAANCVTASFVPSANTICEIDAVWNAVKAKWILKFTQTPVPTVTE